MRGEIIAAVSVVIIIGSALLYIIRAKKKGKRCIGCPGSHECRGNCSECGCHGVRREGDEK